MNGPLLWTFTAIGIGTVFCAALVVALAAGVWVCDRVRQNRPVPYYPVEGLIRLAEAIHNEPTPLFDQVLEESDWRHWADELGDVPHE